MTTLSLIPDAIFLFLYSYRLPLRVLNEKGSIV